ncbi:hypothetical protein HDN1F_07600 [gamma proteobacterium HdN1]|nr:hypothetical protein HDN1F_07600 [gamma proteobacterium HdN1]
MRPRKPKLNDAQQRWVRDWWRALQPRVEDDQHLPKELLAMGRGERAQLRRCKNANELLSHEATLLLAEKLISLNGENSVFPGNPKTYELVALMAGVLVGAKDDLRDGKTLAWHLGHASGNERPKMSDLRFKIMQRAQKMDDLYIQWRRAVKMADGKVDIARLADDLLSWLIDLNRSASRASDGVKFHWAYDFYLNAREHAASQEPESNKEISK